ncbi:MAG TPA: (Fe-S)-binding protein [Rudaea sp.]|jgi:glycolate oxidase iron-sulfur subunit
MQAIVNAATTVEARITALAGQCVKCGLCLPHCPTYRLAATEAESPRGRIAFAQALAEGKLDPSPSVLTHLDNCLACMACERVCPSQVKYGELITTTRAWLHGNKESGAVGWLVTRPRLLGVLLRVANLPVVRSFVRSRGMRVMLRPFGMDRALAELPHLPDVDAPTSRAPAQPRGRVGLFLGCVAASVDRDVHAAARTLLDVLDYDVALPAGQGCCGALALHDGDAAQADRLASALRAAFAGTSVDTVLVSASGCFGTLRDHVFADSGIRVREIHEFLDADSRIGTLKFRPLAQRIAVHTPCTQRNVARADGAIARLLARIPQLRIDALTAPPGCCGAAGDYFLRKPDVADALRVQTLDAALAAEPEMLVTSNVGCRIFLGNGLRRRESDIPVTHPLVLLARQLEN